MAEIPGEGFTSGGLLDRVKGKAKQVLGSRNSRLGKLAAEQKAVSSARTAVGAEKAVKRVDTKLKNTPGGSEGLMRFGRNVEVRPLGGIAGCLTMVLISVVASLVLTLIVNVIIRL